MDIGFIQRFVSDCKSDIVRDITILQKYLFSSGVLVISVNVLQLPLIFRHLLNWTKPREQSKILLIILIPSIIGIASFIALHANEDSKTLFLVLDTFKECSVGLGLALYLSLLYTYMDINPTEQSDTEIRHKVGGRVICNVFPVTLFQPRYVLLNKNNLKVHKYWTWQFVFPWHFTQLLLSTKHSLKISLLMRIMKSSYFSGRSSSSALGRVVYLRFLQR